MENKYENVAWSKDKNKYRGHFEVGGKRYHGGYSKDPYECYLKTQIKKEQVQKEYWANLVNLSDPGEVWKDIPGCEGTFLISNLGRLKSLSKAKPGVFLPKKEVNAFIQNNGKAKKINFSKFVVEHFLGLDPEDYEIAHKDKNTLNISIDNLICTSKQQLREAKIIELQNQIVGLKGIYLDKQRLCYETQVEQGGKSYYLSGKDPIELLRKKSELKENLLRDNGLLYEGPLGNEEFRFIKDTDNQYQISNIGRLIKLDNGFWTLIKGYNFKGYIKFTVCKKTYSAHQLVAQEFLGHIINGHSTVVDHINHDPLDNRVENLQIISNRENSSKKKTKKHNLPMGVVNTKSGKFMAIAQRLGKKVYLGRFDKPENAHEAYVEYWKTVEEF
jgi:hypothetical protein